MSTHLTLSQACEGMIHYKQAAGVSPNTIVDYRVAFKKLSLFFDQDPEFASITRAQLIDFFAWLQKDYVSEPAGVAPRGRITLSAKTVLNTHTNLSSLWHWAVDEGYVETNLIRKIHPPEVTEPVVETYTKEEIEMLLKACGQTRNWKTRPQTASNRSTAMRDRALILVLTDTGLRASELCNIRYCDLNMSANSIKVFGKGRGRDGKERHVYFGQRTASAIWKMLLPRTKTIKPQDLIFVVGYGDNWRPMTRQALRKLISRIGERAGLRKVHPHRFRHTFAVNYLRNGGNVFTLMSLLGHSDLEMTLRYSRLSEMDAANGHRKASPVDNWRL